MSERTSGETLDSRFTLLRRLGRGGMGEVWLVHDRELDEDVAAKVVPRRAGEELIALLRRECQNARRLAHPNIVRVFDFHRGDEHCFITMEPVEGEDLSTLRGAHPAEIVRVLLPVADALSHAHALGVVHRDLKAGNVLLDATGAPRVVDFGISAVLAGDRGLEVSGGGSRHGMSPQQLDGRAPTPSDDIYALGALLYELITGRPPLWPDVTDERIRSAVPDPMLSPHGVPARLQALVSSMLAKSPRDRPRDMREVGSALAAILAEVERPGGARAADGKRVRLTPPPRTPAVRPVPREGPDDSRGTSRAARRPVRPAAVERGSRAVPTAAILVPLALLVVVVVFFLPGWLQRPVEERNAPSPVEADVPDEAAAPGPVAPPGTPAPGEDVAERAAEMRAAGDARERATNLRDRLQARGAVRWAPEGFAAAQAPLARADDALARGEYGDAREAYDEAIRGFEDVAAGGAEALSAALERGGRALAAGDAAAAVDAFTLAATIDPDDSAARTGLRRAEVLDEVLALLDDGALAESRGDTADAERAYRRAADLDPLSQPAQQSLARVQSKIGDDAFAAAMSEGLAALERGDHGSARAALERAGRLRPGSDAVAEAMLQVDQARSLDAIVDHRRQAAEAEKREDWRAAVEHYDAILGLDPSIRFAQEGRERSGGRLDMATRIGYHLAHPHRLSTEEVFEEALELLVRASDVEPAGPKHRQQVEALDKLVEETGTPVPVVLTSDALTEVTVYRVGRMGAFERRELSLRPGAYTVVGTRPGYRDVRLTLEIRPGERGASLDVRCGEPI
jgi:tetratricopeptide (TPR) repeat protein